MRFTSETYISVIDKKNSFVTFVSNFGFEERDKLSKANRFTDKFSKRFFAT